MKNILFDLDGTLTDPGEGITNSVQYALKKMGIEVTDKNELYKFIGPPLIGAFCEFYNMSEEDARLALTYYREYFSVTGIFENEKYEGIEDLLSYLIRKEKNLYVATSKPELFAEKIIEHFGFSKYFIKVEGSTFDEKRVAKEEVIEHLIKTYGINPEETVMVGDRKHDIIGAHKNKIKAVGVLYGYGDLEELKSSGADYIAKDVSELKKILTNL